MIQLSFTKDLHTPVAIWFDEDFQERPSEYQWHFYDYEYLSKEDAEQMLNDPYTSDDVKTALADALDITA